VELPPRPSSRKGHHASSLGIRHHREHLDRCVGQRRQLRRSRTSPREHRTARDRGRRGVAASPTCASTATQPEWQTLGIVDVDGASFTLSDFVGCPVFVANFATWCGECREQLGDTQQAAAELYGEAIFIALSVETDISPDDVAAYAEDNGFSDIRFAVMSPEMLGAMVDAFGNSAINPSSTPHVFIAADGIPGELLTGFETPHAIIEALRAVA